MTTLYCIEHEGMVNAQNGNPAEYLHEVWTDSYPPELDWCEFPLGYAFCPPPPSLASELDNMPSDAFAQWCNENDPDLQIETLI